MSEYEYLPSELMSNSEAAASAQAILGAHRMLREQANREWVAQRDANRLHNILINPDYQRRAVTAFRRK